MNEKFYMIFVEHPKSYSSSKDPECQEFINGIIEKIHDIIIANKNSYQNPSKLDELQTKNDYNNKNDKVLTKSKYGTVYPISSLGKQSLLYAYLCPKAIEEVKALPNIKGVSEDRKVEIPTPVRTKIDKFKPVSTPSLNNTNNDSDNKSTNSTLPEKEKIHEGNAHNEEVSSSSKRIIKRKTGIIGYAALLLILLL
eukprot:jgi/Orpsp1_1/1192087/evm.model.d7180000090521.1